MKLKLLQIGSTLILAAGLSLIFGYCHGTAGLTTAVPIAKSSLEINISTAGAAGLGGFALTVIGLLLLIVTLIGAIVGLFRRPPAAQKSPEDQSK